MIEEVELSVSINYSGTPVERKHKCSGGSQRKACEFSFAKKARLPFTFRHKSERKKESSPKTRGTQKCYPLLFFENGQTTSQETHNHKVNENHKTKHDFADCAILGERRLSEMQFDNLEKPQSPFSLRTALIARQVLS